MDWPIPIPPNKHKGIALTEMQKANLIWLAKGKMEDIPEKRLLWHYVVRGQRRHAGTEARQMAIKLENGVQMWMV